MTSPTFTLGHVLRGGDIEVAHLDLYRLGSLAGEDPGVLDDYLTPERIGVRGVARDRGAGGCAWPPACGWSTSGGDRRAITVEHEPARASTPPPRPPRVCVLRADGEAFEYVPDAGRAAAGPVTRPS